MITKYFSEHENYLDNIDEFTQRQNIPKLQIKHPNESVDLINIIDEYNNTDNNK